MASKTRRGLPLGFIMPFSVSENMLRRHDEELLDEIDERERQRQDDERRRNYD